MATSRMSAARKRWANWHPLRRMLLVAVLLAAGVQFGVKPAYQVFEDWRVEQDLAAAKVAMAEGRMNEARDLCISVPQAETPRIDALRILEKSMAALGDSKHVETARALMSHPESSDEDRLNGFRTVALEAPMGIVGQAWTALPERCQQRPEFAVPYAERLLAAQRAGEADGVLLAVPETARNEAVELGLIRVLLGRGQPDGYEEAQRRIAAKWPTTGTGLTAWLELLEDIPVQSLQAIPLAPVRKFLAAAAAAEPDRHDLALALARLDYVTNPSGRAEVIEETLVRWQTSAPVAVARLLRDVGLPERLLATFPVAEVSAQPALLPYVLEALEQTGEWPKVKLLLEPITVQITQKPGDKSGIPGAELPPESAWGITHCELLAHQAVAAWKTGDTTVAEQWEAAMDEAKFSTAPDAFLKISRIAQDGEMEDEATGAILEAVLQGHGPLPLFSQIKPLVEWLIKRGRESNLLQVCATYLQFEPDNPALLTQYHYLACLSDLAEPAKQLKAIQPLAAAYPKDVPIQCVLATAYLCNGDGAAAAAVLDRLTVDVEQLAPGFRATFLATQVLNDRMDRRDPRLTGFPWKALLPSERKRFGEWLKMAPPDADMAKPEK